MVEYSLQLDDIFGSLADATRRDILRQVSQQELAVGEIAHHYQLTLAAISKHLKILEKARLITKRRRGKYILVQASPEQLQKAEAYLRQYAKMKDQQLDALQEFINRGV